MALGLFFTTLASLPTVHGHGVVDQSTGLTTWTFSSIFNGGNGPIFQAFTPSVSPLVGVDLGVGSVNTRFCPADFTVRVRSGSTAGPILGQTTLVGVTPKPHTFPPDPVPILHFEFDPEISLTTGSVHYIEASTTNVCAHAMRNGGVLLHRTCTSGTGICGINVGEEPPATATASPTGTATATPKPTGTATASPTPTETPPPAVGGIALSPGLVGLPAETPQQSSTNKVLLLGIAAAVATSAVTLGGAAWYSRRRTIG